MFYSKKTMWNLSAVLMAVNRDIIGNATICLLALIGLLAATDSRVKADFIFGTPTLVPNVNSGVWDWGSSVSADGLELYFGSRRSGGQGGSDLWVSRRATIEDEWGTPLNLGSTVNSSADDGTPSISADGLELYFVSMRSGGSGEGDLWVTRRAATDEPWGAPVSLGSTVNSSSIDQDPCISHDGLELYFSVGVSPYVSFEIMVTRRATTEAPWGTPVSLAGPVNSSTYNLQPSLSANGLTLFFGSWRSPGYGEQDMWFSTRATTEDDWGEPVNLGSPVNSSSSEVEPTLSHDGLTLYFSSDRPGGLGNYDMWQVSIRPVEPVIDFNGDKKVDFNDFAIFAQSAYDDGELYGKGLAALAEHWLEDFRLLAHWKLDEEDGGIAYDSAGDNDGVLNGDPNWQPTAGRVLGAIELDGENDYVSTEFVLDPANGPFSVYAWVKAGAPEQVVISQVGAAGRSWLAADPNGMLMTDLRAPVRPLFGPPLISDSLITDGDWHRIALVWDGSYRHLYTDGEEVATDIEDQIALVGDDGGLYFGAEKTLSTTGFFDGMIDDIRIYDEVVAP